MLTTPSVLRAEMVTVELSGITSHYPKNLDDSTPEFVGNRYWICTFTYDDQTPLGENNTFYGAIKSFRLEFFGGGVVTATSGDMQNTAARTNITNLYNHNFPDIGNWTFGGRFHTPIIYEGNINSNHNWNSQYLPTAHQLSTQFRHHFTWIFPANSFILSHRSMRVLETNRNYYEPWFKIYPDGSDYIYWRTAPETNYQIWTSTDLKTWTLKTTSAAQGWSMRSAFEINDQSKLFFKIEEVIPEASQ